MEEAIEHYQEALRLEPASAVAAFNLGLAFDDTGQDQKAIKAYEQALRLDASLEDAHYCLVNLYNKAGNQNKAQQHLSMYQQLTPSH